MKKIMTEVVHSQSKTAWNVIGKEIGGKYKIARIPYNITDNHKIDTLNKFEALEHAEFISKCFNNYDRINELFK